MTFTRIGVVAAKLVADPAKLIAAANGAPQNEGGGSTDGGTAEPPDAQTVQGVTVSELRKGRGAKPRQVQSQERGARLGDISRDGGPALVLVIDNGMRGVHSRPDGASPAPAPRSPLVMVVDNTHYASTSWG